MAKKKSQQKKNYQRWQRKLETFEIPTRTDSALSVIGNIARLAIKADFDGYGAIDEVEEIVKNAQKNIQFKDRPLSQNAIEQLKNAIHELSKKDYRDDIDKWVAARLDRMIDLVFK